MTRTSFDMRLAIPIAAFVILGLSSACQKEPLQSGQNGDDIAGSRENDGYALVGYAGRDGEGDDGFTIQQDCDGCWGDVNTDALWVFNDVGNRLDGNGLSNPCCGNECFDHVTIGSATYNPSGCTSRTTYYIQPDLGTNVLKLELLLGPGRGPDTGSEWFTFDADRNEWSVAPGADKYFSWRVNAIPPDPC